MGHTLERKTVAVHGKITAFVRYRQMQDLILLNKLLMGDADGKKEYVLEEVKLQSKRVYETIV